MALRNVVKKGDDILRKKCRPIEKFDDKLATLVEDMIETMYDSNGVGLAGPQVGLMRRIVVIDVYDGNGPFELINPEILSVEGEQEGYEGCLSCPDETGWVVRPFALTVKYQDKEGNWHEKYCEELLARAVCHETDHLDGILFIDKAEEVISKEEFERLMEEEAEYEEDEEIGE